VKSGNALTRSVVFFTPPRMRPALTRILPNARSTSRKKRRPFAVNVTCRAVRTNNGASSHSSSART